MPKIIDGNVRDLVEAEIDSAHAVKLRRSRQALQPAAFHLEHSQVRKMFGEIAGQIVNGRVPHNQHNDTFVGAVSVVLISLVEMIADDSRDISVSFHVGEVDDFARISSRDIEFELARKIDRIDRVD